MRMVSLEKGEGFNGLSVRIMYQPKSASAAACRRFIDIELADRRTPTNGGRLRPAMTSHHREWRQRSARVQWSMHFRVIRLFGNIWPVSDAVLNRN